MTEWQPLSGDELDRARAYEAIRLHRNNDAICAREHIASEAARLAREGWMPPDPLEAEVQNILANYGNFVSLGRGGAEDAIRKALERGIEIGKKG